MLKLVSAFLLLLALPLAAQQSTGTISGTVTDPQGAAVGNAQVRVVQVDTAATFRTSTNDSGNYTAPGLAVGRYEVQVETTGFKKAIRSGIVLQVNQNARVDVTMEIGQLAESVNVTADAALVDTGSATLGQVVENRRVQELPLNGRSALALTFLTSGVVSNSGPTQTGFGDRGVALSSVSINGGPNALNAQMLDGNNNVLSYVGEVGIPPAVDAVEEFKVQSGPMSAEFGYTAGGAINMVTKSGTNRFRGTLYEFLRNDKFDARNTFSAGKLPFRYNQYGGSLGGPILKNKLFGFFNFEQYISRRSTPRISTMPLQAWRDGDYSRLLTTAGVLVPIYDPATTVQNPNGSGQVRSVFPGNQIPKARFDPAAQKVISFFPQPNKPSINQFTENQNYLDAALTTIDWTQINYRVDYMISDKQSIFLRYTQAEHDPFSNSVFTEQTVGDARDDDQTNRNAVVSHTYTLSPTLINSFRVGINRQAFVFKSQSSGDWAGRLGLPSSMAGIAFPRVDFGFGVIGGGALGTRTSMNWDIQDMVTKITGQHTLKIGANYRQQQGNNEQGTDLGGNYNVGGLTSNPQSPGGTGSNMAQFLLGEIASATTQRVAGASWQGKAWNFFIQDDWKITRQFTVNLGVRWDYQQKPYERNNGQINFDLTKKDPTLGLPGIVTYAGLNGQPRNFIGEDYNDWSPRLGFAWDVLGRGKTILRGGYGVFYPSIFWRTFFGNTQFFTTTSTSYAASGPGLAAFKFQQGFPFAPAASIGASAGPSALLGQGPFLRESDPTTPLTQQWTMSLQHQIGLWLVEATYAGNKGNHFATGNYNINTLSVDDRLRLGLSANDNVPNPLAGKVPGGLGAASVSRLQTLLPYPQFQSISILGPRMGNYTSHQLQLNLRRNFRSGLALSAAFTGGKKLSDSSVTPTLDFGYEQTNETGFQDGLYNRHLNKSVDPNDVSQRMVVTALYELPFGKGQRFNSSSAIVQKVIGGWQVNSVGIMQTGLPLIVRGATNFLSDRPNTTGDSFGVDNPTRQKWFNTEAFINPPNFTLGNVGRTLPSARTPGTVNWDLSLIKNTEITERFRLQFRAESFNFLNHTNLGPPNTSFSAGPNGKNQSAAFGTIASARDARIIQFGLKLIF